LWESKVYYTDVWATRRLMEGADSLLLGSLQRCFSLVFSPRCLDQV